MEQHESSGPELAVILAAYRRREYLDFAIDSVLRQTISRSRMEILVVTDFDDPELDRRCAEAGILRRIDTEPVIGRWLLSAVDATRAPLVAIVDDDDELEPERFARALERFSEHPETNLYRNRVSVIAPDGRPIPLAQYSRLERAAGYDRGGAFAVGPGDKDTGIRRLRRTDGEWFNISTMVFRREIFTPSIRPEVERAICQDLFTFSAAAVAPGALYFDDQRLTRYRHHPTSASRLRAWKRRHWEDHIRFAAYVRDRGPAALAAWLEERAALLGRVVEAGDLLEPIRSGAPPRGTLAATRAYLRRRWAEPILEPPALVRWGSGAMATAYGVAPRLSRRMLEQLDARLDLP